MVDRKEYEKERARLKAQADAKREEQLKNHPIFGSSPLGDIKPQTENEARDTWFGEGKKNRKKI